MKLSGSAPYLSWLASAVALFWSKLPLISVATPLIACLLYGEETTTPSNVKATKSAHGVVVVSHVVIEVVLSAPPVLCAVV